MTVLAAFSAAVNCGKNKAAKVCNASAALRFCGKRSTENQSNYLSFFLSFFRL